MRISYEEASSRLDYSPETGDITWKTHKHAYRVGQKLGYVAKDGYYRITLKYFCSEAKDFIKRSLMCHNIAWILSQKPEPGALHVIDHIDQNKANNKLSNLRLVTHMENNLNISKARSTNKLQLLGVREYQSSLGPRFTASLYLKGKPIHLGVFGTAQEAANAYTLAKEQHFPGLIKL